VEAAGLSSITSMQVTTGERTIAEDLVQHGTENSITHFTPNYK
jgi:hypothetical protein